MEIRIRQAVPEDAASVAKVLNSVIAERRYSALDTPFSVEEERSFIASLARAAQLDPVRRPEQTEACF